MTELSDFTRISDYLFELPKSLRSDMRVPARVYIDQELLQSILNDRSVEQLINVATLPGIEGYSLAMPDIHQGYGFPVGGIAAIRTEDGVISPGGIGYDINCGVRLLCSRYTFDELAPKIKDLANQLQRDIPSGVGRGGYFALDAKELDRVLDHGMQWAKKQGYASDHDVQSTEEFGQFRQADSAAVSKEAKQRGRDQLGTMGAGNHFVEVQRLSKIFDQEIAESFGLFEGQICVMIHTGSRGLGHQTCTDYVRKMNLTMSQYDFQLPDRELACAPFSSEEGRRYFAAMAAAANFAWVNRQLITYQVRNAFLHVLKEPCADDLRLLYDVSHNIAKLEHYNGVECLVHRKGATRAFGPGRAELPEEFQRTGQPVIIPGSMGTASYVLAGTEAAMQQSFGSCCHGAGRALSRMRAKKTIDYNQLIKRLEDRGVVVRGASAKGLLEEAPEAYKDVDKVVNSVEKSGISKVVAKLAPVAVIKG
ncbi:MAG: RNA-splicing ligase RtcB [Proteobacteria bacterium]|nr:MAG: RNA-splicing ligase RtcB [Pseudomonadota bacterium]